METTINQIRNILRKEGITGMDSINHCIVFIISKILNNETCKKLKIDNKYSYEKLMFDETGKEIGNMELYEKFYKKGTSDCFVGQLVNKIGFKNIKFKLEDSHNLKAIMNCIDTLDINKLDLEFDIIGTIYEIHLKSGTSNSMRDLGQFYTNRQVINYMIELCDPKMIDGNIETIIDPTMGTGGFLTMAIKYLNNKYKKIDWLINKNNICGYDIDDNVRNMALINIFLEIGELSTTLIRQDTLTYDLSLDKYDIILANEPMGIKNIDYDKCCKKIKDLDIKGTNAEPLFLQLFMESLNIKGRCAVIIPDGFLFNNSKLHINTRKHLIENFDLQKIIMLNDDFFINTGVKTSILYFVKTGKTKEVKFFEIKLKNNIIEESYITKCKYDELVENNYSLFINKYNIDKEIKKHGFKYEKLGDICIFLKKSKRQASYGKDIGKYSFYTSSQKIKKCDEYDYDEECIIIGTGGNVNIKYDKCFSCSADNFILTSETHNVKYIYYYLLINIKLLENGFKGTTIKHLSKDYIIDINIPIPNLIQQMETVEQLNYIDGNNKTCIKQIEELKKINKIYIDTYLYNVVEFIKIKNICIFLKKSKRSASYGKDDGKYSFYTSSQKIKKCDEYDYNQKSIIVGTGGNANIKFDKKFSCSADNFIITSEKYNIKYIYYYLLINIHLLENGFKGTTIKHLSKEYIELLEIPVLNDDLQNMFIEYCDNTIKLIKNINYQIDKNNELMLKIVNK